MQKPPPDFRTNFEATHPPILIDSGLAILENDKIERHIMKNIPGGYNLFVQDKDVATLIENVYSKLKLMLLKKEENKNNSLMGHLKKINDHLANRATRFLTGGKFFVQFILFLFLALRADDVTEVDFITDKKKQHSFYRHDLLFRLWIDATTSAHPSGW